MSNLSVLQDTSNLTKYQDLPGCRGKAPAYLEGGAKQSLEALMERRLNGAAVKPGEKNS